MWGRDTPLAQKGHTPFVDEDKWCCAVCLYVVRASPLSQHSLSLPLLLSV